MRLKDDGKSIVCLRHVTFVYKDDSGLTVVPHKQFTIGYVGGGLWGYSYDNEKDLNSDFEKIAEWIDGQDMKYD